jgi:hypothetical protein
MILSLINARRHSSKAGIIIFGQIRNLVVKTNRPIKLTLYTKANCSLCYQAKNDLEDHYNGLFEIEEVDITKSKILFRKYKLDIPVFFYNDQFLMQHKIDREALEKLIESFK